MNHIRRGADGNMRMSRKGLFKQSMRKRGESMKEKEKKCWTCGSMPWRVEGKFCSDCGIEYKEEEVGIEIATLKSVAGNFEDNF